MAYQSNLHRRFGDEAYEDPAAESRSLVDLVKELRDETSLLVRQEVALAKTEMSEKAARVGRNASYIAIGGGVALAAVVVLMFALSAGMYALLLMAGMTHINAGWLAPLIVSLVGIALGAAMAMKGVHAIKEESVVPERTIEQMKADKDLIKEKVSS